MNTLKLAFVAAGLLVTAPAFAQEQKPLVTKGLGDPSTYAALAKAPEKARIKHNPFQNDATAIAAGRNLFQQHCSECHGNSGDGSKKAPSLRVVIDHGQNCPVARDNPPSNSLKLNN